MGKKMKRSTTEDESSSGSISASSSEDISREEAARRRRRRSQARKNTGKKERSYSQGKEIIKFLSEVKEEVCKQSKQITESKQEMYTQLEKLREEMCKQSKQASEGKEDICKQLEKVKQDNQEMRKQLTEILTDLHKQWDIHANGSSGDDSDALRSHSHQVEPPRYRLVFKSGAIDKIDKGQPIDISVALVDGNDQTVENGPLASATVELVVVKAEFNQHNNQYNWSREDFESNIKKAQQGNSATVHVDQSVKSIVSNGRFNLVQGVKRHSGSKIFRNSGNKKVRLGVMVVSPTDERVLEGLSDPFFVRGHDRFRHNNRSNMQRQALVDDGYEEQNGAMPNTQNLSWESLTQSEETRLNITGELPQFPITGNNIMFSPGLNITGGQQPRLPFLGNTTMFSTESSTSQDQEASIQQCQVPHLPILAQATNNQTDELSVAMYGNVRNPNFMRNNYVPVQAIGTQFNTNHIALPVHLVWDRPNLEPSKHHWDLLEKLMPQYKFNRCGLPMNLMQDFGSLSIIPKEVVQTRCKNAFIEPLEPEDSDDEEWPLKRMLHNRYRLRIVNKVCKTYYTWDKIKADDGSLLRIALLDENNTKITSGPLSSASVEVVALHGDFNLDGQEYWTSEEFNRSVVCPLPGEEASSVSVLLGGDHILVLADGEACLSNAFFQRTSICARTGMFQIGVMLASAQNERVQEGISEPFLVMDNHVKELNAKDGPTQGFNPAAATLQFPRSTVKKAIQQEASRISHVKARSAPCMSILPAALHTAAMARLGVIEARATTMQQKQQLLQPTEVPASRTTSPVLHLAPMVVPSILSCSILQRCFLCQRELTEDMDIYMYRGDRAFCSQRCRYWHMMVDGIDSGWVTVLNHFQHSGSCYNATPSLWSFLEGRQVQG